MNERVKFICDRFVLPDCRKLENIDLSEEFSVVKYALPQTYAWDIVSNEIVRRLYIYGVRSDPYVFTDFLVRRNGHVTVKSQEVYYTGPLSGLGKLDQRGSEIPIKALISIQSDTVPVSFIDYMASEAKKGFHPELPVYKQQVVRRGIKENIDITLYCAELKALVKSQNEIIKRHCDYVESEKNIFKLTYQLDGGT